MAPLTTVFSVYGRASLLHLQYPLPGGFPSAETLMHVFDIQQAVCHKPSGPSKGGTPFCLPVVEVVQPFCRCDCWIVNLQPASEASNVAVLIHAPLGLHMHGGWSVAILMFSPLTRCVCKARLPGTHTAAAM